MYDNIHLSEKLKEEIEREKYKVYLQPKYGFYGMLREAEALIRYEDNGKVKNPYQFIPYLEMMRLIDWIDLYVFERICSLLSDWKQRNIRLIPISINFSRETLIRKNLVIKMEKIREEYNVHPKYLIIEITETVNTKDTQKEREVMDELKRIGYQFSLDDFGVDYSNLKAFIEYPFSSVKIDKELVGIIETNWKGRVLLENIISVCHEIGAEVIAEGIENKNQYEFFKEIDCDMVQGYYIDIPLSIEVFEKKYMENEKSVCR